MLDYEPKILLAFAETLSGNQEIFNWLMQNGYPELGALSMSMRGTRTPKVRTRLGFSVAARR